MAWEVLAARRDQSVHHLERILGPYENKVWAESLAKSLETTGEYKRVCVKEVQQPPLVSSRPVNPKF